MSILLPESFVDVSTMREIPDTQECWADAGQFFCVRWCSCGRTWAATGNTCMLMQARTRSVSWAQYGA
jgi:hypothetical protein